MYAVFNPNKKFISFSDGMLPTSTQAPNFLYKEIPEDKSNLLEWRWDGDYDTGEMVAIEKNPYPNEYTKNFFENKYSFYDLLSVLLKQTFLNSEKLKTTDYIFKEMVKEYILSFEDDEEYVNLLKEANKLKNEN